MEVGKWMGRTGGGWEEGERRVKGGRRIERREEGRSEGNKRMEEVVRNGRRVGGRWE